jgi:cytochrome P450
VRDFADPLPAWLIAQLIGISASEWPHVQHWSHTLKRGLGRNAAPDAKMEANHALEEFRDTILALLAERRGQPQTDLLSTVMELADQGEALSEAEIVSNCLLMLIAGHEAVTSLLVNGVLALLEHPDQLEHLRLNPALYPSAIEEIARYGHPMQMIPRYTSQDLELGGQPLKQGQTVIVFLGAANYDPEVFSDPRQFDISRSPNPHLGYGYGAHYCFGAPFARLASPLALQQFLERYPTVRLAPEPPAYLELLQDMVIRELRLTL